MIMIIIIIITVIILSIAFTSPLVFEECQKRLVLHIIVIVIIIIININIIIIISIIIIPPIMFEERHKCQKRPSIVWKET